MNITTDKKRVLYNIWKGMIARCENPNQRSYPRYGGRGITVCDRWRLNFDNFANDIGPRPMGGTVDRINPDGNYEPSNCCWATMKEQRNNLSKTPTPKTLIVFRKRRNGKATCKYIRIYGMSIHEIAAKFGVRRCTISSWNKRGILKSLLDGTLTLGKKQGPLRPKYKKIGSKYKRLYGMTIEEISVLLNVPSETIRTRHKNGDLPAMLQKIFAHTTNA